MIVVGEIGIEPDMFKDRLAWWEIRSIIRGYNRRSRDQWSSVRWQTYNLMSAQAGSEAMKKAGIHRPTDLMLLPWEQRPLPSENEVEDMVDMLKNINQS